jgi:hypothetical protein
MELESNLTNGYMEAYRNACNHLKERNPEEIAGNCHAVFDRNSNTLRLKYFKFEYVINCYTGEINCLDSKEQVTSTVKVLILHYLINACKKPLSGKFISFKEIPGGGSIYYQTFQKRAIVPLIKTFSKDFLKFYGACEKLEGKKEKLGHASVTLKVFPLVPVTYVIWQGDEEVADSGTILFDESITSYLPAEDIVLAASFGTYALMEYSKG